VSEQGRFNALFDLQDASRHEADRLLLDSVLVEHAALGSGRGHGSGHQQYELRLRSSDGAEVRAFFKPANGLGQRSLEMFGQMRASCVLAEALAWRLAVALGPPYAEHETGAANPGGLGYQHWHGASRAGVALSE
jgi:hypothetical protein